MNDYLANIIANFEECSEHTFATVVQQGQQSDITWLQLEIDCRQTIVALNTQVTRKGVVLIFMPHSKQLFGSFLGCMLGGYIPSFMPCLSAKQDADLYWKSHQTLIDTIEPVAILTDCQTAEQMESAKLNIGKCALLTSDEISHVSGKSATYTVSSSTDIAFLQHSSGTTGLKKGVMLSYDAITKHSISYGQSLNLKTDDIIVSWLPLYHDMGLIACLITPAYHGIKTVQIGAFEWLSRPQSLFKLIEQHSGTLCWMPNFAFEHLTNTLAKHSHKFNLKSMRAFISCSEPCKAATIKRFSTTFKNANLPSSAMQNCYAMAETVFGVTQTAMDKPTGSLFVSSESLDEGRKIELAEKSDQAVELTHCGMPIDGVQVSIVNERRNKLDDDYIGEIAITGSFLFDGYNKDSTRTSDSKPNDVYYSKDLGFVHKGNLYVLGRTDDLLIVNGRNLYAHQVEAIASNVSGLKPGRVVAFSIFDDSVGTDILAILAETVSSTDSDAADLHSDIVRNIQAELNIVPNIIELVSAGSLIKTSSGKMSRKENKARYIDAHRDEFQYQNAS